ncbi:SGNH/GDSL hydrolase family protein [Rhodophyticola porphyridii]|uniref:SGNH/GDSL hydrolase family protein n=1 Tax=Rhodophyticola porphyridii TaxID=1852017 RepID=UPI001B04EED1|nr:SGNH/GDSL hydrolase family protein [Roseicyclus sp.]MBO6625409.1 SGNH/GDSL hydrolase family protein [Roseicyclus sp.]MBO6923736.1 SGNH/GDSL hydrolase family protein [Roseicyclus sp.]
MALDLFARVALFPLLAGQAIWTRKKALNLPEPDGPRRAQVGQGPVLRILIAGDSSAAGVGVATQDQALSGQLAAALSREYQVHWHLIAKTGATTQDTLDRLARQDPAPRPFDIAIVALGVNDVTKLVPLRRWLARQAALVDLLETRFGARLIYLSGLPPVRYFPLLPQPLRWVLGRRAERFDVHIRRLASADMRTRYIPLSFEMDAALMAPDGFHPGPDVYAKWAEIVAGHIRADWPPDQT